jgi:hypothetical protein
VSVQYGQPSACLGGPLAWGGKAGSWGKSTPAAFKAWSTAPCLALARYAISR